MPTATVTLANAGHMPPYLNGEPLAMEGALAAGHDAKTRSFPSCASS